VVQRAIVRDRRFWKFAMQDKIEREQRLTPLPYGSHAVYVKSDRASVRDEAYQMASIKRGVDELRR
jgi:hypothetical protein